MRGMRGIGKSKLKLLLLFGTMVLGSRGEDGEFAGPAPCCKAFGNIDEHKSNEGDTMCLLQRQTSNRARAAGTSLRANGGRRSRTVADATSETELQFERPNQRHQSQPPLPPSPPQRKQVERQPGMRSQLQMTSHTGEARGGRGADLAVPEDVPAPAAVGLVDARNTAAIVVDADSGKRRQSQPRVHEISIDSGEPKSLEGEHHHHGIFDEYERYTGYHYWRTQRTSAAYPPQPARITSANRTTSVVSPRAGENRSSSPLQEMTDAVRAADLVLYLMKTARQKYQEEQVNRLSLAVFAVGLPVLVVGVVSAVLSKIRPRNATEDLR